MDKPKALCSPLFQSWGHKKKFGEGGRFVGGQVRPGIGGG